MTCEMEPQPRQSRLAVGLAAAGVAVAGWRLGPAGAVAAAGAQPWLEDLLDRVGEEWRDRKGLLLSEGAEAAARRVQPGITADEMWEALTGDDERRALTVRVLEAARRTGREDKLRLLGAILGRVAVEEERLDEAVVLAAALDDLEGPHVVVLQALREQPPHGVDGKEPAAAWFVAELVDRVPLEDGIVRGCLGTIGRHGLARDSRGPFTGEAYELTGLGRVLLDLMRLSRTGPAVVRR